MSESTLSSESNSPFKSDKLNHWLQRGSYKKLCGKKIFYIDEGASDKPTILLIHGFPTSSFDFLNIWPTLLKQYRLVSLDMLGFGFSDKPNRRDYTIHKQADLFDALLIDLEISEYHILTHDYGVSVAQELLARQLAGNASNKCLSCCFLNGGLFPETHRAILIQKLMLSPLGKWLNKLAGFKQFSSSFSSVFGPNTKPSYNELCEFWEAINYNDGKHVFHNLITYIRDRKQHKSRWLAVLQNTATPLALINGSLDPVSGRHLVSRYKELNCRLDFLTQLPNIGHYPQVESPQEMSEAYLNFMQVMNKP